MENKAKSSSFQENQPFISDIPIFEAKDPQSFDDWIEQIDKVASLTNKEPYRLTLAKPQGSISRMITSFLIAALHGMEQNKKMVTVQFWFSSYQTACSINVN